MKKLFKVIGTMAGFVCLLTLATANAVPVINTPETFNSGLNGWQYTVMDPGNPTATVTSAVIGSHTNALYVSFKEQSEAMVPPTELVHAFADTNSVFTGDYRPATIEQSYGVQNLGAAFKFYSGDSFDGGLALFFHSSISGNEWRYGLSVPATLDTWYTYAVPIAWSSDGAWNSGGLGETEFLTDLASVDQIGILVQRSFDTAPENYGLDDFQLYVPEPSTYAMLAFTFLTLGLTMRRKKLVPVRLIGRRI